MDDIEKLIAKHNQQTFFTHLLRITQDVNKIVEKYRLDNQTNGINQQLWLSEAFNNALGQVDLPKGDEEE